MKLRTTMLAALAAVLTPAATAAAKPVSVPLDQDFLAVAYAPGRVLVAEPEPFGARAIIVRELRLSDRAERVLLAIPYPDDVPDVSLAANATGFAIALRDGRSDRVILGREEAFQRPVLECLAPPAPRDAPFLTVAAGTTGFAFAGARCGPANIAVVGADGAVTPINGESPAPDEHEVAYAEPYLALPADHTVRVIDVTTGTERRVPPGSVGDVTAVAVRADGMLFFDTIALDGSLDAGLYTWAPGAPTPTFLGHQGTAAVLRTTGERVVLDSFPAPLVVGPGGHSARLVDSAGTALGSLLGVDDTHVAFRGYSCAGGQQVTVADLGERQVRNSVPGCPVRFARTSARFGPSGRAHLRVLCRNGCENDVSLVEQATSDRRLATAHLRLRTSPHFQTVTFRLTGAGRRLRHRVHRVDVVTNFKHDLSLTVSRDITTIDL